MYMYIYVYKYSLECYIFIYNNSVNNIYIPFVNIGSICFYKRCVWVSAFTQSSNLGQKKVY